MHTGIVSAGALVMLLLVGCGTSYGGTLKVTTPEIDDAPAIANASAFYVQPVDYDFERHPDWDLSDSEWDVRTGEWTSSFNRNCASADKAVYSGGEAPPGGASVEFRVTDMNLGTYAFVYKKPGWIRGVLTIKDSGGNVIFRGAVDSPGTTSGTDRYSLEGRIKVAHSRVARDVRWLINRKVK